MGPARRPIAEKAGAEHAAAIEAAHAHHRPRPPRDRAAKNQARRVPSRAQVKLLAENHQAVSMETVDRPKAAIAIRPAVRDRVSSRTIRPAIPATRKKGRIDASVNASGAATSLPPEAFQVSQDAASNRGATCSLKGRNRIDPRGVVLRQARRMTSSENRLGFLTRLQWGPRQTPAKIVARRGFPQRNAGGLSGV